MNKMSCVSMRTRSSPLFSAVCREYRVLCQPGNKDDCHAVVEDCLSLAENFGRRGVVALLNVLVEDLDFGEAQLSEVGAKGRKLELLKVLVQRERRPVNLASLLCQALLSSGKFSENYLNNFVEAVGLDFEAQVEVALAVALTSDAVWSQEGLGFLKEKILEFDQPGVTASGPVIQELLAFIQANEEVFVDYFRFVQGIRHKASEVSTQKDLLLPLKAAVPPKEAANMALSPEDPQSLPCLLEEIGYLATSNEKTLRGILEKFHVNESAVAEMLGKMIRSHTGLNERPKESVNKSIMDLVFGSGGQPAGGKVPSGWDFDLVVDVLKAQHPDLNWFGVATALDNEDFYVPDLQAFNLLMTCFKRAVQEHFPLETVIGRIWRNAEGQVSFLRFAVQAPPDVFTFEHSRRKMNRLDGIQNGKTPFGTPNHAWLCLDLVRTLCHLGEKPKLADTVTEILAYPLKHCQEVLLVAVATVDTDWGKVQREVAEKLLPIFIASNPNTFVVLHRIWAPCKEKISDFIARMYEGDSSIVSRVLDICQELKALPYVLNRVPHLMAVDMASLAARREYLNLDKWLKDKISSDGLVFMEAVLKYLNTKLDAMTVDSGTLSSLTVETLDLYLRVLKSNSSGFPPELAAGVNQVEYRAGLLFPQLHTLAEQAEQSEVFASDIEEEANVYFHRIYSEQTRLEDVITMLKQYKMSSEQREQEVFACMVHNLFDEYRFFPNYPEKALHITAMLFGQLIHHQLVSSITLGIALRYVLDALRKTDDVNMFKFGLTAINQFKQELPGWPQYCSQVLQIAQVKESDPDLIAFIEAALANKAQSTEAPQAEAEVLGNNPDVAVTTNPDATLGEPSGSKPTGVSALGGAGSTVLESASELFANFTEAPERVRDRVAFLFNNLSAQNIDQKVNELLETVPAENDQWLANYVVVKRAAQESNFQPLYMSLLDKLGNKRLLDHIVQFTYQYIKILLENDKIKVDVSNRSLLKNLGSWLGQLTLAKNKPVRQKDLDLKAIIYEAYEKGKMVAVIPFVHKVLEQCRESKVYGPDNPWIRGILTLLAEIYNLDGLKMNISFEIEMIFKDFGIDMKSVERSKTLDGFEREIEGNPDFYDQDRPAQQTAAAQYNYSGLAEVPYRKGTYQLPLEPPGPAEHHPQMVTPQQSPLFGIRQPMEQNVEVPPVPPRASFQPLNFPAMPNPGTPGQASSMQPLDSATLGQMTATLHQLVMINPTLATIAERFPLKRLVAVGIDRAIYEIITPVVERSVMIACTTTKELVTKDFAMEPDEKKLRQAAHLMVSSLAGSLALVTCKEPLKVSLFNQLKAVLQNVLEPTLLEHTVNIVIADNLELGCTIIEKASTDKAVKEVDERLLPYYQSRQKARAASTPFYDMSIFNKAGSRFPAALPESLRPRPGHLSPQITRVYDDFARIPRANQQLMHVDQPPSPQVVHAQQIQEPILEAYKPTTLAEKFAIWQNKLDAALAKENQALDVMNLSDSSEIHGLVAELIEMVNMTQKRDDVATTLAEKLFILLYDRPSSLSGSVICSGLNAMKNAGFARLPAQLTSWYCHLCHNEARRFNRVVINSLAKAHLIHYPELDVFLAGCLSNRGGPVLGSVDFVVSIINQNIIVDRITKASDLPNTLEVLRKLASTTHEGERIVMLIDDARKLLRDADPDGLREQVAPMFDNWAKIVHADPTEKNVNAGIEQFVKAGFLKGDDVTNRFFRICIELSVLHCVNTEIPTPQGIKTGDGRVSFIMIDAFVKLVSTLMHHIENVDSIAGLKKILEIIVLVLYRDHDDRTSHFNSRPYYRIFIGLYHELLPEDVDDVGSLEVITTLASALISCRPQRVPGFAFAWMELFSHRMMLPRLLKHPERKGWTYFRGLFMGILIFMQPYLRHGELGETLRALYKGLLRIMLVLLQDFPEFYCEFHVELCNIIPPSCVQMRNLVLSASPSHIRLPDPFTPNINVEVLPNIKVEPKIVPDVGKLLPEELRTRIEEYVKTGSPAQCLDSIIKTLILPVEAQKVEGTTYNMSLMNCLVLYTGMVALSADPSEAESSTQQLAHAKQIYKKLAHDLDSEGRYLFLNGVANQLRFPNSHTLYFSTLLLSLFAEAENRALQEQITRVVLERLIVQRPHPWGLLMTFVELISDSKYRFWELGITASAPEIEHLFEAVARSCLPTLPEGMRKEDASKAT